MKKSIYLLAASLAAAALLAACGGSGDSVAQAPAATGVPDSANASIAGMAAWITSESEGAADTAEPLDVAAFNPPLADDIEPLGLAI